MTVGPPQVSLEMIKRWQDTPDNYLLSRGIGSRRTLILRSHVHELSEKLFSNEGDEKMAGLCLWEMYRRDEGFSTADVKTLQSLCDIVKIPQLQYRPDPRIRYVSITALHARERLSISKDMFYLVLAYHLVTSSFLEHILAFGRQHVRRDPYGPGFWSNSRHFSPDSAAVIPELGRSGQQIEMCYSLQSPEQSGDDKWPWSVRQCAVYHASDLHSERVVWITIKGNKVVENLITSRLSQHQEDRSTHTGGLEHGLRLSLAIHLELCTWAAENWHLYLRSLEESLREKTDHALSIPIDHLPRARVAGPEGSDPYSTDKGPSSKPKTNVMMSWLTWGKPKSKPARVARPTLASDPPEKIWRDLQAAQGLEEKANDAITVLTFNMQALSCLADEYNQVCKQSKSADSRFSICSSIMAEIRRFRRSVLAKHADMDIQRTRARGVISRIQERKVLVSIVDGVDQARTATDVKQLNNLIQYKTMHASQVSSQRMQELNQDMHLMAQKTQMETVTMRVITVVTLIFLPGTFISALMSTPVVSFDSTSTGLSSKVFGTGALQLYAIASLPLMGLTFMAWYAIHWWERRKERPRTRDSDGGHV